MPQPTRANSANLFDADAIVVSYDQLMTLYSALAEAHNALLNHDAVQELHAQITLSAAIATLEMLTRQVSTH